MMLYSVITVVFKHFNFSQLFIHIHMKSHLFCMANMLTYYVNMLSCCHTY